MQTRVYVFTFREGLLARLAHDLRLTVGAFELRLERGQLQGWLDPESLLVDGVAHGERIDTAALSAADKRKIQQSLTREVLDVARYPRIELDGRVVRDASELAVDARLRMHGAEQALRIPLRFEAGHAIAEVEIRPSDFGIAPYKALGGAIRVRDCVRVRVEILAERDGLEALSASGEQVVFHGP